MDIRESPVETEMKARTRTAINVSTEIVRIETVGGRDENTEPTSQILLDSSTGVNSSSPVGFVRQDT